MPNRFYFGTLEKRKPFISPNPPSTFKNEINLDNFQVLLGGGAKRQFLLLHFIGVLFLAPFLPVILYLFWKNALRKLASEGHEARILGLLESGIRPLQSVLSQYHVESL